MSFGAINEGGWRDGPTVFAIAWIPKCSYYVRIPDGLWKHRHWYSWWGMMQLTGNDPPPDEFSGPEDLERFVRTKAYRGIVGYRNVRIRHPQGGETSLQAESRRIHVVGYTPLLKRFHSRGESASIATYTNGVGYDFVNMQNDLEFRVSRLMNFLHKMATCHRLPHASATVHYSLDGGGNHEIIVSSTDIPNLTLYVNWKAVDMYSIHEVTVDQAEDFVTAYTNRRPAKEVDRFVIECKPGQELVVRRGEFTLPPFDAIQ